jgi:hypothetical protein
MGAAGSTPGPQTISQSHSAQVAIEVAEWKLICLSLQGENHE